MSDKLIGLRRAYLDAEERQQDACRRATWLEKNLYEAPNEGEFNTRLDALKQQERLLQELTVAAIRAKYEYMAADMATR